MTGWQGERQKVEWGEIERRLETRLPADFKEICEVFGRGAFCGYLELLPVDSAGPRSLLGRWTAMKERWANPRMRARFEPYQVFEQSGLILWGQSVTEASYYWLADASASPETWPIVARTDPLEELHRFDVSTSEFICRVLTDRDFRPFSVASKVKSLYFEPYG
ncbi:hypothetical protein [Streptomyces sp. AS02]|uniref:hypothetical protein n=1 Tax=Streptomyces sp. AS02 TaxID=2938946 RepID=UPI0020216D5F|nr:hypothetical protein [Streptomyces sp. AS02]MCL8010733.1 hypothetical protein [Streptomyces sp. AS02]